MAGSVESHIKRALKLLIPISRKSLYWAEVVTSLSILLSPAQNMVCQNSAIFSCNWCLLLIIR